MRTDTAYDYDSQQWITGPVARTLLGRQLAEEIALIESAEGARYLRVIGAPDGYLATLRQQFAALTAAE